jgi:hypothetical protein
LLSEHLLRYSSYSPLHLQVEFTMIKNLIW